MTTRVHLPLLNEQEARFECIYGRGCDGICCQNGRPGLNSSERQKIQRALPKIMPMLRPAAQKIVQQSGVVTKRKRDGLPLVPVQGGWCIFFNEGCVLHKLGAQEGDAYQYKPIQCALFPLLWDDHGNWYVRQKGYMNETWSDLFCLDPKQSNRRAIDTLQAEIAIAASVNQQRDGLNGTPNGKAKTRNGHTA